MSEKNCNDCGAKCCKYVVMEIDIPEKVEDFEEIKWFVAHENVQVFVDSDGTWNIEFVSPCRHLNEKNQCGRYETRPGICREFSHDECPHHNEYNEVFSFKKIEDVDEYIEKIFNAGLHKTTKDED